MPLKLIFMNSLNNFFNPKRIVVIGASNKTGSVGGAIMSNIKNSSYKGDVIPVNIRGGKIRGVKSYKNVLDIDKDIDLAVIATPAATVPELIRECGRAGVKGAIIISSGFSEVGKEGIKKSKEIAALARKYGIRMLGPNCLGFINPKIGLNATFTSHTALPGKIAFISQSGALCSSILGWSRKNNVGFSYFVSIGEMADLSFYDLIDYFANDPGTESILIYMESLKDARKFLSAAREVTRSKPIVVLKSGRSARGAQAAKSHTGSLAGNDKVFSAAFDRAGMIRVDTILDLFHVSKILSMQPRAHGGRFTVLTNAGGPGVLSADAIENSDGELAKLEKNTLNKLNAILPKNWSHSNPVDILGDATKERYRESLEVCLRDKNTDVVLVILTPQTMTDPSDVAREIVKVQKSENKIIIASWMGGDEVLEGRRILERGNIPIFRTPEDAIRSFLHVYKYSLHLKLLYETPASIPHAFTPRTDENKAILDKVANERRGALNEAESKKFLENYDIPVAKYEIAKNYKDAGSAASRIGYPVAMKVLSPDILHKTDVGGLVLGIKNRKDAEAAFKQIVRSAKKNAPKAKIEGVIIEAMVNKKYELIIGSMKDAIFGPAIIFGMGGISVEVFKDTRVGLPPLNMALALRMIKKTKIYKLLKGYRGMPGVDIESIQFLLYKFAYLLVDFPEIKELDINPFAVDETGGIVIDAKVVLDKTVLGKAVEPHSHLSISPYPKDLISRITAKNGSKVTLRPILPEDEPLLKEMFESIKPKTKRFKFFEKIKDISHNTLQRFTQIDYDRDVAIVGEVSKDGKKKIVSLSRLVRQTGSDKGELAVVVVDSWQRQKIGGKIIDYMIEISRKKKLRQVFIRFYDFNGVIAYLLEKKSFDIECKDGECVATKKL